jgi:GNAT superfamily N-acetyltransferase
MSKHRTASDSAEKITCRQPRVERLVLRRFDPRHDSWEHLTKLLHRAFAKLAALGLHCSCVDQAAAVTRQRALAGDCFVAVCNGRIVGTLTLESNESSSPCEQYRHRHVASVHQFAIDPPWQSRGIGKALLAFASQWAAARGFAQLALDTPLPAAHLIAYYRAQGFSLIDVVRFAGRAYDSAIFCKPSALARPFPACKQPVALPCGAARGVAI